MSTLLPAGPDARAWLAAADDILHDRWPATTGGQLWWPKACACLIRLALESAIDSFWQRTEPAAARGSRRAQLRMLRRRAGRDLTRRIAYAWATLSRHTHCQCYDPTPTLAELGGLHREVTGLVHALEGLG